MDAGASEQGQRPLERGLAHPPRCLGVAVSSGPPAAPATKMRISSRTSPAPRQHAVSPSLQRCGSHRGMHYLAQGTLANVQRG
eukprot:scaffold3884_cov392-Prasinococcus_capsulatus_cf.AAC.9